MHVTPNFCSFRSFSLAEKWLHNLCFCNPNTCFISNISGDKIITKNRGEFFFVYWWRAVTQFYTNTRIIKFKWKIPSISPHKAVGSNFRAGAKKKKKLGSITIICVLSLIFLRKGKILWIFENRYSCNIRLYIFIRTCLDQWPRYHNTVHLSHNIVPEII